MLSLRPAVSGGIWDTHTPEFSDGFPADFLSLPACKSAMLQIAGQGVRRMTHLGRLRIAPSIWDTHTPEFSDGFPADFLSPSACKSAMLPPWLAHALKSSRQKVLKDATTAFSGVSAAHFYAETTS